MFFFHRALRTVPKSLGSGWGTASGKTLLSFGRRVCQNRNENTHSFTSPMSPTFLVQLLIFFVCRGIPGQKFCLLIAPLGLGVQMHATSWHKLAKVKNPVQICLDGQSHIIIVCSACDSVEFSYSSVQHFPSVDVCGGTPMRGAPYQPSMSEVWCDAVSSLFLFRSYCTAVLQESSLCWHYLLFQAPVQMMAVWTLETVASLHVWGHVRHFQDARFSYHLSDPLLSSSRHRVEWFSDEAFIFTMFGCSMHQIDASVS